VGPVQSMPNVVCLLSLLLFASPAASLRLGTARRANGRRAKSPTMHCLVYPIFTLIDLEAAKPLMEECVEVAKAEDGCVYYGFTVSSDKTKLFCREAYVDGKAASAHLQAVVPIVSKMIDAGCVALDSIGVMGTAADLADIKEEADKLSARYWEMWDSFSNFKKSDATVAAMADFVTIQPTFTIIDRAKAEPLMKECFDATKAETGCIYYGWAISGEKLFCSEAYVDGAAANVHLEAALPIVGAMIESGAISVDSVEFHGPAKEWAAVKENADGVGTIYYDVDVSFSKFAMP